MKPFSKKTLKASFPDDEYRYYDEAEERGSKEISMYDPEYEFLKQLAMVVGKTVPESVPEIKALSQAHPFETIDDAGDLAAQIWTLATEKYGIPREWLMKKLPEKKASLKKADLWPAQAAAENTLSHEHNSLSYNPLQEPDLSVSGPKPIDVKMDLAWSIISDKFFTSHDRWSSVVSELKSQIPSITDEDITLLKDNVRKTLDAQMGSIASKKQKNTKIASDDLTQFALGDKAIRQHFQNRGTTVEDVLSSLPNFTIKYIPKELEKQDPTLASGTNGFYDFKTGTLYINPRLTLDNKRLTIIHEIEHAIQDASGVLPVHTENDLNQVKRTPYMDRTFEWGARQQQFNALKARGMSLDQIVEFLVKRNASMQKYDEYQLNYMRDNIRNEVEQMEDIYNEMMPESIMASKTAKKKSLNMDKVVQVLNQKEPKVIRVDPIKAVIELTDGSIVTFDEATKRALDIDKTGVFSGAEFSTTEFNVNPTLDNGPFSSPEDYGSKPQKGSFPSVDWQPAGQESEDEEPYSNIASELKKPFSKKADFSGQAVNTVLKGLESSGRVVYNLTKGNMEMPDENHTSTYTDRENVLEGPVDFNIVEGYIENNKDLLQDVNNSLYAHTVDNKVVLDIIKEQLPAKAISKKELNIVKKADESPLTQEDQNEISAVSCPAYVIALNNYYDAVKRGHQKDRALQYALDSVKNIEKIDEKKLVEFINTYL